MVKFFFLCVFATCASSNAFKLFVRPVIARRQQRMCNTIPDRSPRPTFQVQCESPQMNSLDSEQMNELNEWQERNLPNENMVGNASVEVPALDPVQVSIKEKEERLAKELQAWEENLVSERLSLLRARDKMFDSGKNAYYSVQAQVNDFMRNKDAEQKADVNRNKRIFAEKMLPIVDAFRHAATLTLSNTPKIESMHSNYGSLLNYIMLVLAKFGFSEFTPAVGEVVDVDRHEVVEVTEPDRPPDASSAGSPAPVVVEVMRAGWQDTSQSVLRKALVVASGALNATITDAGTPQSNENEAHVMEISSNDNDTAIVDETDDQVNEQHAQ